MRSKRSEDAERGSRSQEESADGSEGDSRGDEKGGGGSDAKATALCVCVQGLV